MTPIIAISLNAENDKNSLIVFLIRM